MADNWRITEEIISFDDVSVNRIFTNTSQEKIKIRGRCIRDQYGRLRPVLIKTLYQSVKETNLYVQENTSCWSTSAPYAKSELKENKSSNWFNTTWGKLQRLFRKLQIKK